MISASRLIIGSFRKRKKRQGRRGKSQGERDKEKEAWKKSQGEETRKKRQVEKAAMANLQDLRAWLRLG